MSPNFSPHLTCTLLASSFILIISSTTTMGYPNFFPSPNFFNNPSPPDYSDTNPSSPYYSDPSSPNSNPNPSSPYYNNNPTSPYYGYPSPPDSSTYNPPSPSNYDTPPSSPPPDSGSYNPPSAPSGSAGSSSAQEFLDAHNKIRSGLGLGSLTWDDELASYASAYAAKRVSAGCGLVHSGGRYGENLAEGTDLTASQAVQMWVDEKQYYNYDDNSCSQVCGHYTQVVWKATTHLGCAATKCSDGSNVFVICSYDPPGNYVGQRPY
ncbi:pathogenesis-related gene 1 [Striga asiatica]|uniref:Pathogenesis-related gene 1 n=1 Tax=Striga asiatica TaxID=4170 RepID=A0A5A7QCZ3_STRAF|nr:pathogenesis-related gene 1 [Striga asiatica]